MNFSGILKGLAPLLLGLLGLYLGWRSWGWAGVSMVGGAIIMWALLHFTRMMKVLRDAANRPKGRVGSAVMLNARLKKGATLLHVMARTKSMGELLTPKDAQPEVFRWTDNSDSTVTCTFEGGKLSSWELVRPAQADEPAPPAPGAAA